MSKRVEWVDRIIESLDTKGRRSGPPKTSFLFTREQFREHLLLAYNNGRNQMKMDILDAVQRTVSVRP